MAAVGGSSLSAGPGPVVGASVPTGAAVSSSPAAAAATAAAAPNRAQVVASPMPDLSHLTEDERRIIESVLMRQRREEEQETEIVRYTFVPLLTTTRHLGRLSPFRPAASFFIMCLQRGQQ